MYIYMYMYVGINSMQWCVVVCDWGFGWGEAIAAIAKVLLVCCIGEALPLFRYLLPWTFHCVLLHLPLCPLLKALL